MDKVKTIHTVLKSIFSALSIAFVLGSFCLLAIWMVNSSYFYLDENGNSRIINISNEEPYSISNILVLGSGKANITKWIEEESSGRVVHKYNNFIIDSSLDTHILHDMFKLPVLPKGNYVVKAKIIYKPNPIKTGDIELILKKVTVK